MMRVGPSRTPPRLIRIDDPDDERFRRFRLGERGLASRSDKRDDSGAGLFLAEGDLVVERALEAGCVPVAALVDAEHVPEVAAHLTCPVYAGGIEVRQVITRLGMPQRIVAMFERPARPSVAELAATATRLVVAEAVDNPANVGGIVRNAAGLGWHGLILDHTSADPLSRRSLRVAMGTTFSLPHARTASLVDELAGLRGFQLLGLTPRRSAVDLDQVTPADRIAVVVGSERSGLSATMLDAVTPVRIPVASTVDSLNVAAATAIACWALRAPLEQGTGPGAAPRMPSGGDAHGRGGVSR